MFIEGVQEVDNLAKEIGFDLEKDREKYWWFFKQILLTSLPGGYEREIDIEGKTWYNKIEGNYLTKDHPLRHYFRKLFARILTLEKELQRDTKFDDIAKDDDYIKILKHQKLRRDYDQQQLYKAKSNAVIGKLSKDFYFRNLGKNKLPVQQALNEEIGSSNPKSKSRLNHLIEFEKAQDTKSKTLIRNLMDFDPDERELMLKAIEKESLAFYELNFGDFLKAKDVFDSFLYKQMNLP